LLQCSGDLTYLHAFLAGMALSCSLLEDFRSVYLAFTLAIGTPSLASFPFLIFAPFEESSSSYPCYIEGFFLELPSRMPTLSWGVLWSASFMQLRSFGSCPWLYRGLLLGASLRMPTLFWGIQWSACLSGLHRATLVLQLLPFCNMEGFFLELLLRMPTLLWGIQGSACLPGLHRVTSFLPFFYLGRLLGLSSD